MQNIEYLEILKEFARSNNVPIVRDITANRLVTELKKHNPKKILEIGTAIGYSALLMKSVVSDAKITTIEKDEDRYNQAIDNIAKSNVCNIRCILGDAFEVLDDLIANKEKFDFVFLDGPKGFYYRYLQKIKELINNGACIFADNVGFFGMVKSGIYPHRHKTIVVSLTNYLKEVSEPPFQSEIDLETDDGFAISTFECQK